MIIFLCVFFAGGFATWMTIRKPSKPAVAALLLPQQPSCLPGQASLDHPIEASETVKNIGLGESINTSWCFVPHKSPASFQQ